MINGAIFDVDGTLLDSMKIWDEAAAKYLAVLGIAAEKNLAEILFDMSLDEGAHYLKNRYSLPFSEDKIKNGVLNVIENFYLYEARLKDGAKDILEFFNSNNINMIAATSSDKKQIQGAFKRLDILKFFKGIITCSEIGKGKTSPDIYIECSKIIGTKPNNTLVFEDALFALKTAKNAGFKTVAVFDESSKKDTSAIKGICSYYAESLEDAANWGHHLLSL